MAAPHIHNADGILPPGQINGVFTNMMVKNIIQYPI
jgi:hypothetical protein